MHICIAIKKATVHIVDKASLKYSMHKVERVLNVLQSSLAACICVGMYRKVSHSQSSVLKTERVQLQEHENNFCECFSQRRLQRHSHPCLNTNVLTGGFVLSVDVESSWQTSPQQCHTVAVFLSEGRSLLV